MNWLKSLLVVGVLAIVPAQAQAASNLEQIKAAGVLKIGTEGTYAPFTYHDASGKLVGFDVEIGEAIAKNSRCQARVPRRQMGWADRRSRRQSL